MYYRMHLQMNDESCFDYCQGHFSKYDYHKLLITPVTQLCLQHLPFTIADRN